MKTARPNYRFGPFELQPWDRRLLRDGIAVEVNNRCLDVLVLLVAHAGELVEKSRFIDEVWQGVPVTDEALTQTIKTLRRCLGDDASRPRFVETVHRYGYRFIAPVVVEETRRPVQASEVEEQIAPTGPDPARLPPLASCRAGLAGGAMAGALGGAIYGLVGVTDPLAQTTGALSTFMVLVAMTAIIGSLGGAGVGLGVGLMTRWRGDAAGWSLTGGAAGGLLVGAGVKFFALDALGLVLGISPAGVTGGLEGLFLGGCVGLAVAISAMLVPRTGWPRALLVATAIGSAAGGVIILSGGQLMGTSLANLADLLPDTRLSVDQLGRLTGEHEYGWLSRIVTGVLEGALFSCCVTGAILRARRVPPAVGEL